MRPFTLPSALLVASALAQKSKNVECADGLYLVVARGTGEEKGAGMTGEVADDVADRVKGSIVEPLDYPATFLDPAYDESEADGVKAMTELLTNYHSSCPDGKIAVFGYSQVSFLPFVQLEQCLMSCRVVKSLQILSVAEAAAVFQTTGPSLQI